MRPRVAVLAATSLPWHRYGGLERHVFQLCRWLRKRDVSVDLYLSRPERFAAPFAGDAEFRLHTVPGVPFLRERYLVVASRNTLYPVFSLRMGRRVARDALRNHYAAVIAQGMAGLGYAVYSTRLGASPPLILNPQGMEEAVTPSPVKRALYAPFRAMLRLTARRAAAVVATDHALVGALRSILNVPCERVVIIPNAIDVAECLGYVDAGQLGEVRATVGAEQAHPLIVTVGRLAPNKGFEIALDALGRVRPHLPESWRWVVIGEGPRRAALARRVRDRGLAEHVRLAGNVSDREMHNLLATADLFLNPTLYEGSSLVTLEAMSHGCAVVASRAGGIPDKIEDGVTGWLAEPGNIGSLVDAIERWRTADPATRSKVRAAARDRCRERFDWPVCVDLYLEAVRRLSETRDRC